MGTGQQDRVPVPSKQKAACALCFLTWPKSQSGRLGLDFDDPLHRLDGWLTVFVVQEVGLIALLWAKTCPAVDIF